MIRLIDFGKLAGKILRYGLAAAVVCYLASKGVHPAWGILLVIYRKAALRILIGFALIYWLTSSII